jgi:hypothetical protein
MTGGMGFMQAVNRDCSMENKPDADVGDSSNNHLHHCGVSVAVQSKFEYARKGHKNCN